MTVHRVERPRPVLVTGSHRSGSTWIGRMIAAADELHYVQEPFNIVAHQRWLDPRPPHQFLHVTPESESDWIGPVERVVDLRYPLLSHLRSEPTVRNMRRMTRVALDARRARRRGAAALIKDPIAVFSAPWLVERFDATAVMVVREPVAFAGSLKERDWSFDFTHWTSQPGLMSECLAAYADDVESQAAEPGTIVEQAIVMWNAIYSFVADAVEAQRAQRLLLVSYESIAADPLGGTARLYDRLGLRFGDDQRRVVGELSSGRGASATGASPIDVRRDSRASTETWRRRLDDDEVERVRLGTTAVSGRLDRLLAADGARTPDENG